MSKERDWVDYANLASNLTQNFQLGSIKDRLSDLQEAATSQATEARLTRRALYEAEQKAEKVANYREMVLQGEKALAGLRHHLPDKPLPVLALALGYRHRYRESGLGSECFQSFEDKDRVERFFAGLDEVVETSSGKLSADDRGDAQRCFQYQLEEADLKELVAIQKRREEEVADLRKHALELTPQIAELQQKIDTLDKELQAELQSGRAAEKTVSWKLRESFAGFFAILAALSGLTLGGFVLVIIFRSIVSDIPDIHSMSRAETGVVYSSLLAFGFGMFSWMVWPRNSSKKAQLNEARDVIQRRLTALTLAVSNEPAATSNDEQVLHRKFGGGVETASSIYDKMLAERRTFVSDILSGRRDERESWLMANARIL
ncbi:MAG: hypothetical protein AB9869_24265 [Verrucomicrobiia bacterium]